MRLLVLAGLLLSGMARAELSRGEVLRFFRTSGLPPTCLETYEAVPRYPVARFLDEMLAAPRLRRIGAGVEGVVFADANGNAWKIALAVVHALGLVEIPPDRVRIPPEETARLARDWARLRDARFFRVRSFFQRRSYMGWPMRSQSLGRELVGNAVWSVFTPGRILRPHFASEDEYAFRTDYVPGPTFRDVLSADRAGTNEYDMRALWREIARLQRANENLVRRLGLAADAFSPMNMVVSGPPARPSVVLVDNGMSVAQPSAVAWLAGRGNPVPVSPFAAVLDAFSTPMVVSELVVSHRLWKLSFEQSLAYLRAYTGRRTHARLLAALAEIPQLVDARSPRMLEHGNIRRARELLHLVPCPAVVEDN